MNYTDDTLPDNINLLKEIILQQAEKNKILSEKISILEEFIRLSKQQKFSSSSEKDSRQGELFNEAEATAENENITEEIDSAADEKPVIENASRKNKPVRKPLPADLPRIQHVYELPLEQRQCACGCTLTEIGEDISEQLDIVPAQLRVIQNVRKKYACKACEDTVKTADRLEQFLPKSNASPNTLAYVIINKYQDGLPLYRLSNIFQRMDIDLSRQTLSGWMINAAQRLQPVTQHLQKTLLQSSLIHLDETRVQVLREPDKAAQSQSYMWVQKSRESGKSIVLFHYDSSRSGQVPLRLLDDYRGALMTDGYEGYNAVVSKNKLTHLCCMAHARRKFVDAKKALPAKTKSGKIDVGISVFAKLYAIEQQHKNSDSETRYHARQQHSLPLLLQFKNWLDQTQANVLPKGKLGEAMAYAQKYWRKLTRYVENGDWPIDNNAAENAIRPFVIGRKNWLFSNTVKGADASATLYSLIETAKANG